VVQHTSSSTGDTVNRLKSKTTSLFNQFGLDQRPEVEELGVEFSEAAEPFKGMETDYTIITCVDSAKQIKAGCGL